MYHQNEITTAKNVYSALKRTIYQPIRHTPLQKHKLLSKSKKQWKK